MAPAGEDQSNANEPDHHIQMAGAGTCVDDVLSSLVTMCRPPKLNLLLKLQELVVVLFLLDRLPFLTATPSCCNITSTNRWGIKLISFRFLKPSEKFVLNHNSWRQLLV